MLKPSALHALSTAALMQGTGLVTSFNTKRLESNCQESIRELELQSTVLLSELKTVKMYAQHSQQQPFLATNPGRLFQSKHAYTPALLQRQWRCLSIYVPLRYFWPLLQAQKPDSAPIGLTVYKCTCSFSLVHIIILDYNIKHIYVTPLCSYGVIALHSGQQSDSVGRLLVFQFQ